MIVQSESKPEQQHEESSCAGNIFAVGHVYPLEYVGACEGYDAIARTERGKVAGSAVGVGG